MVGSAEVWAEQGGLLGLLYLGLFVLIFFLIHEGRKRTSEHIACIKEITKINDQRQQESNRNYLALVQETNKVLTALTVVIEKNRD